MIQFDRRVWLRSFSLAAGGLGASRLLGAPQSTPTATAATLPPADHGGGADSGSGAAGLDIGYGLMPKPIAKALSAQGLNNPHLFNRLAVAAAAASLQDASYVDRVTRQVAEERETWFHLFRDLKVKFTPSSGNFVFFETGTPHSEFAAALMKDGVEIGRAFPPYDLWARISIGLPEENAIARAAVRKALRKSPA